MDQSYYVALVTFCQKLFKMETCGFFYNYFLSKVHGGAEVCKKTEYETKKGTNYFLQNPSAIDLHL